MKNLIYLFAVVIMGVVSCGAPAEKEATCDTKEEVTSCTAECTKTCCAKTDTTATDEVMSCEPGCEKECCSASKEATACPVDCTKACCADKEASHDNHDGHSH